MGIIADEVKTLIAETASDPAQRDDLQAAVNFCLAAIAAHDIATVNAGRSLISSKPSEFESARAVEVSRLVDEAINPKASVPAVEEPARPIVKASVPRVEDPAPVQGEALEEKK